jgi:hypothetical protein
MDGNAEVRLSRIAHHIALLDLARSDEPVRGIVGTPSRRYVRISGSVKPSCRRAAFTGRRAQPPLPVGDPDDLFRVPFE